MRGLWLIVVGGVIQIPGTVAGNIVSAITLGIAIGALISLLVGYYMLRNSGKD